MRRTFSVLAVTALMVAMLMASAIPAFAAASENAGCIGQRLSGAPPGDVGPVLSEIAGPSLGPAVSSTAQIPPEQCDVS